MEETKWWRLTFLELILDLYDEHAILKTKASIHRNQFCMPKPSEWKIRFENFAVKKVTLTTKLQSFIR